MPTESVAIQATRAPWRSCGPERARGEDYGHVSFRDWAVGEFDTWIGPVKRANATAVILLPTPWSPSG